METITITKRRKSGRIICYKRFDDYEKGFWGRKMSVKEFEELKQTKEILFDSTKEIGNDRLGILERYTYKN